MNERIKHIQILDFSFKEILEGFKGTLDVEMSDGVVIPLTGIEMATNRIIWELNKIFLDGYVDSTMVTTHYYKSDTLTTVSINETISTIVKYFISTNVKAGTYTKVSLKPVTQKIIDIIDILHNDLSYFITEHAVVLDYKDFLDAQMDDEVLEGMVDVHKNPSESSVNRVYSAVDDYMHRNRGSGFAMMYFTGALKPPQIKTLIGPKGGGREIDGIQFYDTVTASYMFGLSAKASWYIQESRTIAKAAIATGADGLFIETHPNPDIAKSDGANMLKLDKLDSIIQTLVKIREAIK